MNANMNRPTEPAPERKRRPPVKQRIKRGLWILALVLIVVFILQNIQSVPLVYFFWGFTWPLALLILITLVIGMLLGWALTRLFRRGRRPGQF